MTFEFSDFVPSVALPYFRPILVFSTVASLLFYLWRKRSASNARGFPFAPGPKPLPFIGNLRDLPLENEAATYNVWAKQFGELVHVTVLGRHLMFVNTAQAARDLFEKRSANFSDRNALPMINDLMGWDWSFGHMPFGERWKRHRKMFDRQFRAPVAPQYWPMQLKEAHALIRRILDSPNDFIDHLRHNAASTIMKVVYGIEIAPHHDRYIDVAEQALDGMAKAASPGAFLVDILPFLKYVPAWVPGAGFQRKAAAWKQVTYEMRDAPFRVIKASLAQGTATPCFAANLLSDLDCKEDVDEQIETIKGCAGLAYAAGAESTVSALSSFFLAMVLYPEVQAKARHELDTVLGAGRLPLFNDRPSLPYIDALVKETLRWNPVAPLGLPHMATNDDVYDGYFIPAGTTIFGNTWTILHDEETYPEPMKFHPERFLTPDGKLNPGILDPSAAFGYGRRICPGRHMADAQLFISIASILTVFNIGSGLDENGKPIKTEAAFASGMICHPAPFKCSITPRGEAAKAMIKQTADLSA